MPDADIGRGFRDVDHSGESSEFVSYLDQAQRVLRTLKRQTIAALELSGGDAVLDVGCGTGEDLRSLADLVGMSGRAVGIDMSQAMAAEATRRTRSDPNIEVVVADAHSLPFPVGEYAASRAERVLMHV